MEGEEGERGKRLGEEGREGYNVSETHVRTPATLPAARPPVPPAPAAGVFAEPTASSSSAEGPRDARAFVSPPPHQAPLWPCQGPSEVGMAVRPPAIGRGGHRLSPSTDSSRRQPADGLAQSGRGGHPRAWPAARPQISVTVTKDKEGRPRAGEMAAEALI